MVFGKLDCLPQCNTWSCITWLKGFLLVFSVDQNWVFKWENSTWLVKNLFPHPVLIRNKYSKWEASRAFILGLVHRGLTSPLHPSCLHWPLQWLSKHPWWSTDHLGCLGNHCSEPVTWLVESNSKKSHSLSLSVCYCSVGSKCSTHCSLCQGFK